MELVNGATVYITFASPMGSDREPYAYVTRATVLDADNRVVRRDSGQVTVIEQWSCESVHASESEAWAWCMTTLSKAAEAILAKAVECGRKAGECVVTA